MGAFAKARFDSARSDWATPAPLFATFDAEFHFDLDVCASAANTKVASYLTEKENGLKHPWRGVCWCNPPYGRNMTEWLHKAIRETARGVTTVCLIPARTNTSWFHDLCLKYGEVRFVRGRPRFGDAKHGLPFPLAVVIFRPDVVKA